MKTDNIKEVKIDEAGKLCIYPGKVEFTLIWTTATGVHWDIKGGYLYSAKPREWSYFDWYQHTVWVAKNECYCELLLTDNTIWTNVTPDLREQITAN